MILDFFDGNLDGNSWEELCQSCYRLRYQNQHYTEIPAVQGGDAELRDLQEMELLFSVTVQKEIIQIMNYMII